jgi:hypothetical protein
MPTPAPVKHTHPFVPPVALVNTALRLRRLLLRAADAVVPPYLALFDRFMGAPTTALVHAAADLRLADLLADGPRTAEDLATQTGTSRDALERILRVLVSVGVFRREADGRFANNRVSSGLITGSAGGTRGFVEFFGLAPLTRTWANLPATLRGGANAFEQANGRAVWDWMARDDGGRAAFVEGMSSMTEVVAPAIAAAYPFDEVKTVCDVGGGVGIVLAAALRRHPHLRGVLFDSESMLGEAHTHLTSRGVADRVEMVAGSFFETVPRGADAYILKTVLHNWEDHHALQILKNCRAAMDPGHRLLVSDFLDGPDVPSTLVPFMDLAGMMVFGGRERTPEAMSKLFGQAGFRAGRVVPIPGCQAIFEGVAVA